MALENELLVVLLLSAVWAIERCCMYVNASPIIGQILAGLIVGPALLDLIPFVEAFRLLGKLGVMILVIESGLAVDVADIRRLGIRASVAAATGVVLPTLISFALYAGVLRASWKEALAVGASLSPTSLGFSAQLLGEVGELSTPMGHLICTAAVIDDVLSLLLLAEVEALEGEDSEVFSYVLPVLASAGSILVGGIVTVVVSSKTEELDSLLKSLNDPARRRYSSGSTPNPLRSELVQSKPADTDASRQSDTMLTDGAFEAGENIYSQPGASNVPSTGAIGAVGLGDRLLLLMVLALSLLFAYCSALVGSSDLLGCFLGGVALSGIPGVQRVWARQMGRFTQWGARLFFSTTVAFSVPSIYKDGGLLGPASLWKGLMLTVAAVLGKLAVGVFAGSPLTMAGFLKVGWAMNGRGEFSFFIAESANRRDILTAENFSAVVLALLLSSVMAPIGFRRALMVDRRAEEAETVATFNGVSSGGSSRWTAGEVEGVDMTRRADGEGVTAGQS
ncbi:unnamed protein product [Ascophyllum nodosum]